MSRTFCPALGGRPRLGAHRALATLNEVIAGGMTGWVLEADPKNFFGSLDHDWVLRFVEHRVGDPRLIGLIRRWLKEGVLEDGAVHPSDEGTPQGGSISVLLSNLYLHHVLDQWFERVVKCRVLHLHSRVGGEEGPAPSEEGSETTGLWLDTVE